MMEKIQLSDAELVIMNLLWGRGPLKARQIAALANKETGWEKNTVYTMLGRLIKKGAVQRSDPGFICTAAVEKEEIQKQQVNHILNKLYSGSAKLFLRAFIHQQDLSSQDLEEIRRIIDGKE